MLATVPKMRTIRPSQSLLLLRSSSLFSPNQINRHHQPDLRFRSLMRTTTPIAEIMTTTSNSGHRFRQSDPRTLLSQSGPMQFAPYHTRLPVLFSSHPHSNRRRSSSFNDGSYEWERQPLRPSSRTSTNWRVIIIVSAGAVIFAIIYATYSEKVPVIGRRRLLLVPLKQEKLMGEQQFEMIKRSSRVLPANHPYSQIVQRVGKRIQSVAGTDLGFQWEFIVVDEDVENAFCLPGGKVVFFKGLMDKLFEVKNQDESGFFHFGVDDDGSGRIMSVNEKESMIASVMAHEISHALLRHHAEQMSTQATSALALVLVRTVVGGALPGDELLMRVGVLLPFSRKHEYEADLIGLYLMSRACYNPEYAIKSFDKLKEAVAPHETNLVSYISTHPSFGHRVDIFKKHMKNAQRERSKFCYTKSEVALKGVSGKRKTVQYWWQDLKIEDI